MVSFLYYALLGIYGVVLAISVFYYLRKQAPTGDASVDWAIGIFYTAGLAGVILIAVLLRNRPFSGLLVLGFPLVFLVLPWVRRMLTDLYTRLPTFDRTPPLTLSIENHTPSAQHVKLECWFAAGNTDSASLYTTLDYYPEPLKTSVFPLTAHQTRLLAHKSKYVTIMIYELVREEHEGRTYMREIQPCAQFYDEQTAAFRSGNYKIVIDVK